jgi:23S rRNA pseudouridine1911/1915/1917 synthase
LDLFLAEHPDAPDWSRSQIQRLIREENVRIERPARETGEAAESAQAMKTAKPRTQLRQGDRIYVTLPPPEPTEAVPEDIPLDLVYEDADLAVVNKPPGLVVHPAAGHARGTLVNALLARLPDLQGIGGKVRPGIVHRLDKDTSGLMVVAKTEQTLKRLQVALQARRIRREYLTLAWGEFPDKGRIEGNIGRHPLHRKKMAVVENGKPAVTWFRVVERFGKRALLEVRLETGRTHQIRVHLSHRSTPIIGDPVYGVRHKGDPPMERQALHAFRLAFDHPVTGEAIRVEAPLPEDMKAALIFLRPEKA